MLRAYKYRLYPSKQQKVLLNKHFGCCRFVYNWALEKKIKAYREETRTLSRFDLQAELPKLKQSEEYQWLAEVNAQSLQSSVMHMDNAFQRFFKKQAGFPRFKSKRAKQSFQCPGGKREIDWDNQTLTIPKGVSRLF